ncbi:uncharacterized protein LAESUDRAFT_738655 [Laetiporus sulphureus 93-53]|uniref:Uncharacterized protein n=1 Tax=Laetiporus sulphureus 93-53 TaxID=1314785 RepID=A0A165CCF1_9APHY|nr:uncharacterized protein LAESUDRAFT_738655 [Laetiporus sulphureus 93-53]KZT02558.1 hypothetical protein LAESUDRAFT_738655 [Laetiporus sulphureus 93-53]
MLARYVAYTSHFISSAPKYLSGAWHFLDDIYSTFTHNWAHPLVQATIAGSRKTRSDAVSCKLPLRPFHLLAFSELAHHSGCYDDLLFVTVISCAFYACHRIGELVQPNSRSLYDWRKIIKRASLHFFSSRVQYHLSYRKTDRFYQGTTIIHLPQDRACPVHLLSQYVSWRDHRHEDDSVSTCLWFDQHLFALLDHSFGGHSARAGGATLYASMGLSEDIIQALSRWSSPS